MKNSVSGGGIGFTQEREFKKLSISDEIKFPAIIDTNERAQINIII